MFQPPRLGWIVQMRLLHLGRDRLGGRHEIERVLEVSDAIVVRGQEKACRYPIAGRPTARAIDQRIAAIDDPMAHADAGLAAE